MSSLVMPFSLLAPHAAGDVCVGDTNGTGFGTLAHVHADCPRSVPAGLAVQRRRGWSTAEYLVSCKDLSMMTNAMANQRSLPGPPAARFLACRCPSGSLSGFRN